MLLIGCWGQTKRLFSLFAAVVENPTIVELNTHLKIELKLPPPKVGLGFVKLN